MAIRVMVVDDALFMRTTLRTILTEAGFVVAAEAENGSQAVERYREVSPDVVTMDATMPVMDGIMALKEIRAIHPDARVILCTALGQPRLAREAIHAGARDHLTKPFRAQCVVERVMKVAA
jgi:two-component system chemotaxis response regulator CheY